MVSSCKVFLNLSHKSSLVNVYLLLTLFNVYFNLSYGSREGDSINYNECENLENGKIIYKACTSDPAFLFAKKNSNFTIKILPFNATCGITQAEKFCSLGNNEDCGYCNKVVESQNHPVEYLVDQSDNSQNYETWWQSITWREYPKPHGINITISFDKSYELQNDLKMQFKSARPKRMVLEKSKDFGKSWSVWQFYDQSCGSYFTGGTANRSVPINKPDTVICEEQYSYEIPYTDGQVIFPITKERLGLYLGDSLTNYTKLYEAYNDTDLKDFLTFTDIRIRLLEPMTDKTPNLANSIKYYYAISDIEVTASCSCNLHAKYCKYKNGSTSCDCKHNTAGINCEICQSLYNNRPWKPGYYVPYPGGTANECEKCNCNNHSDSCTYNETLKRGQCDHCYHNTEGIHCENCQKGYYRNLTLPIDHQNICVACSCNPKGSISNNDTCDSITGQCSCKAKFTGRDCSKCADGFYRFPECIPCNCNKKGSVSSVCDKVTGNCSCHTSVMGKSCDRTKTNYFVPAIDSIQFQPYAGTCLLKTGNQGDMQHITQSVYSTCLEEQYVDFKNFSQIIDGVTQPDTKGTYIAVVRYSLINTTLPWKSAILQISAGRMMNKSCVFNNGHTKFVKFTIDHLESGNGKAWLSWKSISMELKCISNVRLILLNKGTTTSDFIYIDSVVLLPDPRNIPELVNRENTTAANYIQCLEDFAALSTRDKALQNEICSYMEAATMSFLYPKRIACDCDVAGTVSHTACNPVGGSCHCKPGVYGRKCNKCLPGYHNFSKLGCTSCSTKNCSNKYSTYETTHNMLHHSSSRVIVTIVMLFSLTFIVMIVIYVVISPRRRKKCIEFFPTKKPDIAYIDMDDEGLTNNGQIMKPKKMSKIGYQSFINEPECGQENVMQDKSRFEELRFDECVNHEKYEDKSISKDGNEYGSMSVLDSEEYSV